MAAPLHPPARVIRLRMLSGVTIVCFASSYLLALALELARAVRPARWLRAASTAATVAGLAAQSIYLYGLARDEFQQSVVFSRWHDWCLLAAWVVAAAYLALSVRRGQASLGVFLLPMVLALTGLAYVFRDSPPFDRSDALRYWGLTHGVALLLGTAGVAIGFVAGVMYLIQSHRLKHKLPPPKMFNLPSLEWLQRMNEESLLISS
ncbi:MAG: hypothetical protein KDA41_11480, partial [Planctomycetales bacterium]|nr:hypothetical protein [Planctomycetales bacterium]